MLKQLLTRLSPHIFNDLSKIDKNKEGLIDWCPVCDARMPDKKVLTLKKHMITHDKRTERQMIREAILGGPMFGIIVATFFICLMVLPITLGPAISDYFDEADGHTLENECQKTRILLMTNLYESGSFNGEHMNTLQYLADECDLRINTYPNSGDESNAEDSIFVNEESYDYRIEYAEEKGWLQ